MTRYEVYTLESDMYMEDKPLFIDAMEVIDMVCEKCGVDICIGKELSESERDMNMFHMRGAFDGDKYVDARRGFNALCGTCYTTYDRVCYNGPLLKFRIAVMVQATYDDEFKAQRLLIIDVFSKPYILLEENGINNMKFGVG